MSEGRQNKKAGSASTPGAPHIRVLCGCVGGGQGPEPGALRQAIETPLAQRKAKGSYVSSYLIARLYADLGDKDRAFEWLNTAYQEHDALLEGVRTDFTMDSLHSDPRYAELVRKIGFPQL